MFIQLSLLVMKRLVLTLVLIGVCFISNCKQVSLSDTLKLCFIGDIMGHEPQIRSAYNDTLKSYDFSNVFKHISPIFRKVDFTIANFEATLGGPPYKGFPLFSVPDELAFSCHDNDIDVLLTANNHSCDTGEKGILRTIFMLDSLKIQHTGTFRNSTDRAKNSLLLLEKNKFRIGLLNYTYGTNGLSIPAPGMVNLIDTTAMSEDIIKAVTKGLDKLFVFLHWGIEYSSEPEPEQIRLAEFLFSKGVDVIIGSHPHVLQKMEFIKDSISGTEKFIAYSMGNFVSDQRTRKRDGGAIVNLTLIKDDMDTHIIGAGYQLTWVYKSFIQSNNRYQVIPCSGYEKISRLMNDSISLKKMKVFISDSRKMLEKSNKNVEEIR